MIPTAACCSSKCHIWIQLGALMGLEAASAEELMEWILYVLPSHSKGFLSQLI